MDAVDDSRVQYEYGCFQLASTHQTVLHKPEVAARDMWSLNVYLHIEILRTEPKQISLPINLSR